MNTKTKIIIGVAVAAAAVGGFLWWKKSKKKSGSMNADGDYENFSWPWKRKQKKNADFTEFKSAGEGNTLAKMGSAIKRMVKHD
jgi:predicted negative regulator of RcsB-dependent stress response